ncbi:MAG: peptidylprolyl isomerase [Desulfuromonadales bacterium]
MGGCDKEPAVQAQPLLKINERQISKAEFESVFTRTLKPGQVLSTDERQDLERAFLTQLIDRELTLAEVRRRGIVISPAELTAALDDHRRDYPEGGFEVMLRERGLSLAEWQAELLESLLLDRLAEQVVGERGRVGEMEIDAYYSAHRADFDRPVQVRARQIVVADQAAGERVLAQLRKGEPFNEVAKRVSLSPDAAQGGDLGFFGRDEMPPEFEAVFDLPVGKVSPLVKSDYGHHLFLVEEKRPAARLSREEAAREIRALLEAERRETVYQVWLQELRGKAAVEVDWRQLEAKP